MALAVAVGLAVGSLSRLTAVAAGSREPGPRQQVLAVANNVAQLLRIGDEAFDAWAKRDNGLPNGLSVYGVRDWDFPVVENFTNKVGLYVLPGHVEYNVYTDYATGAIKSTYPIVPHLGTLLVTQDTDLIVENGLYAGAIDVPLVGDHRRRGHATVGYSVERYRWPRPDGGLDTINVPFAWIQTIELDDSRLGPAQSSFTNAPVLGYTQSRHSARYNYDTYEAKTPEQFRRELDTNLGRPIEVEFLPRVLLQLLTPRVSSNGKLTRLDFSDTSLVDGRLPFESSAFQDIYRARFDAYLNQDRPAFEAAIDRGIKAGVFLPATKHHGGALTPPTANDLAKRLRSKLSQLSSGGTLEALFSTDTGTRDFPLGFSLGMVHLHRDIHSGPGTPNLRTSANRSNRTKPRQTARS
jgi:hypothetical protein